jgi:hypothetical protein
VSVRQDEWILKEKDMIIWGSKGKSKTIDTGTFYCPNCKSHQLFKHERVSRYFTLYFIPLFETKKLGEYIECQTCLKTFKPEVLQFRRQVDGGMDTYSSGPQLISSSVRSTTYAPISTRTYPQTTYQTSSKPDKLYSFVKIVFGLVAAIFIFSILSYLSSSSSSSSNSSTCSGQAVDRWFDQSYAILESSESDYELIDSIESYSEFSPLASRAEQRYSEHKRLEAPACLQEIKNLSDQYFFTEWKMYQAASQGDFDSAVDYETEMNRIADQIVQEMDSLYEGQ